jgi:hypothetical protein
MIRYYLIVVAILVLFSASLTLQISLGQSFSNETSSFPLEKGYVNGKIALFIATDASDNDTASSISDNINNKINFAPLLKFVPEQARQQGYEFVSGIRGEGAFGFQLPVASALPGEKGYSPIVQLNFVDWKSNATARELKSAVDILAAKNNGELTITKTDILVNSPVIKK